MIDPAGAAPLPPPSTPGAMFAAVIVPFAMWALVTAPGAIMPLVTPLGVNRSCCKAQGGAPDVEGLHLEVVGVQHDKKGVKVDDNLRTANKRIFAAGGICSPYQFTHTADFMARIVIQNALFFGRKKAGALTIPWATYTSPEIAHVGLYEE